MRSFLLLAVVALLVSSRASAQTAPRGPHRIDASLGVTLAGLASADDDGHWRTESNAPGFELGYAYAFAPVLDVGANLRYWSFGAFSNGPPNTYNGGDDGIDHGIVPSLTLRVHTKGKFEFGATLGAGPLVLVQNHVPDNANQSVAHAHTWVGFQASLGLDARLWVSPQVAIFLGPEAVIGGGHDSSGVIGSYLPENAGLANLGLWLGAVVAP
jgi:hypothetical protein